MSGQYTTDQVDRVAHNPGGLDRMFIQLTDGENAVTVSLAVPPGDAPGVVLEGATGPDWRLSTWLEDNG